MKGNDLKMIKIKINNFRTIEEVKLEIDDSKRIVSLVGLNGSGKTNILRAINSFCDRHHDLEKDKPMLVTNDKIYEKWNDEKIDSLENEISAPTYFYYEKDITNKTKSIIKSKIKELSNIDNVTKNLFAEYNEELFKVSILKEGLVYSYVSNPQENRLTSLGILLNYFTKIIYEKYNQSNPIMKVFSNSDLDESYFLDEKYPKFIFNFFEDNLTEKIKSSSHITVTQKENLYKVIEVAKAVGELYMDKNIPSSSFKENFSKELDVDFSYEISILNDKNNPKYNALESFLMSCGEEVFTDALEIANEIKKDRSSIDKKKIERLKQRIASRCTNVYKEIFEQNDIYAYPAFSFEMYELKIQVHTKEIYLVNIDDDSKENSDGYKAILSLIINLRKFVYESSKNSTNKTYFLLGDEMEKNLHIFAQIKLINYIHSEISQIDNLKLIMTTHSPFLLEDDNDDSVHYVIYRDSTGFTHAIKESECNDDMYEGKIIINLRKVLKDNMLLEKLMKHENIIADNMQESIEPLSL